MKKFDREKFLSSTQFCLLYILIVSIAFLISVKIIAYENKSFAPINYVEIIDEKNQIYIGKEMYSDKVYHKNEDGVLVDQNGQPMMDVRNEYGIPENNIVIKTAYPEMLSPRTITELKVNRDVLPEVIMPNGAMGIISQGQSKGWHCTKGDEMLFRFEQYPSEVSTLQPFIIGYIKDGVLHPGTVFNELKGEYKLEVKADGEYYIYFLSTSSSYLSLKESIIQVKTKDKPTP